jgi:hypothetical protein
MDPRCSPPWVFLVHPSDEIAQLSIDLWPPCPLPRFPAPECCEARTMPPKDRFRLKDLRRTEEARPEPGHPDQQGPVTAAQSKTRRRAPQADAELMAKEQVLASSPRRDLNKSMTKIPSKCRSANIVRDHAMILLDDATPKPDGIFGKDKVGYQFRTLFVICRRLESRSQSGVVATFPHRNGILATFSFGIDVRHDDRAMEGFPVFP